MRRLRAEADRLAADDQVGLDRIGLADLAHEAPELRGQTARGGTRQGEGEDGLADRFRRVDRQLANLAQVGGDRVGHRLALENRVYLEPEREDGLLDAVVELGGDPLALLSEDLLAFRLA